MRSALNPVLWLCGIVTVPAMISLGFREANLPWLVAIAIAPVAVALIGFLFLLFFDRDKLQSEEYQLRKQSLELIQEKGDPIAIDAMTAVLIENPDPPLIENRPEDHQ